MEFGTKKKTKQKKHLQQQQQQQSREHINPTMFLHILHSYLNVRTFYSQSYMITHFSRWPWTLID